MKRTVFISHSSADKIIGEQVCRFLEQNGIACWIAPRDVTPGQNYGAAILDAIDECRVFVLILSSQSNKSGQVVREVERAASTDSIIIPFRVEDVEPSRNLAFYVSSAHWLDASTKPIDQHFGELLTAIRNWEKTVGASEKEVTAEPSLPPPASPSPVLETRKRNILLAIVGAACLAFLLVAVLGYQALRHKRTGDEESPVVAATSSASTTPAPTVSAQPSESVTAPSAALSSAAATAPVIRDVEASSEQTFDGIAHKPALAFDANPNSTWVPKGDGVGESITVHFASPATITSISILCSPAKFLMHNRIRTARLTSSDGSTQVLTLEDKMEMQRFELPRSIGIAWVKLEILSIFPGKKFNRTPIAEIAFNRTATPRKAAGPAPVIKQVTASSELAPEVHRGELKHYEAKLAFDGDDATAWMANGNGVGQWIMVTFEAPTPITSVSIYGAAADAERYEKNNRVKTLRMISSEGRVTVLDLADKMEAQRFPARRPVVTEWVKFEILAVYPGTRHDSTLISEIAFNRD